MRRMSSISIPPSYWDDHDDDDLSNSNSSYPTHSNDGSNNNNTYGPIGCGQNDILCGKDKTYSKHPGNRMFRQAIVAFKELYAAARSKHDKMAITRAVVTRLQNECGARFVRFHDGNWEEITDIMARDKVSHALRFLLREGGGGGVTAAAATTTTGKGEGGKRALSLPNAMGRRRTSLLVLPKRTFSLQVGDISETAACSSIPASFLRDKHFPSRAGTACEQDDDDDDDVDDELEAADAMRQCQLFIFQNLRLDDPLERGLGVNLHSVPLVGSSSIDITSYEQHPAWSATAV